MILDSKEIEKIVSMIHAHEINVGRKPFSIQFPMPKDLMIHGIRVNFYLGKDYYSCEPNYVLHHKFIEPETNLDKGMG